MNLSNGSPFLKCVGSIYKHCPNSFRHPLCQTGKRGKRCPKSYWQAFEPCPPYGQCPYGNNTFQKGASLIFSPLKVEIQRAKVSTDVFQPKSKVNQTFLQKLIRFNALVYNIQGGFFNWSARSSVPK